jgi:hypothetical protein
MTDLLVPDAAPLVSLQETMAQVKSGRAGIGKPPGRYVLQRISAVHPWHREHEVVYDGIDGPIGGRDLSVGWDDVAAMGATKSVRLDKRPMTD